MLDSHLLVPRTSFTFRRGISRAHMCSLNEREKKECIACSAKACRSSFESLQVPTRHSHYSGWIRSNPLPPAPRVTRLSGGISGMHRHDALVCSAARNFQIISEKYDLTAWSTYESMVFGFTNLAWRDVCLVLLSLCLGQAENSCGILAALIKVHFPAWSGYQHRDVDMKR